MRKVSLLLSCFLLLTTDFSAFGQKIIYPETNNIDARFDNFYIENGEAGPSTSSIMQDKKGFFWFGTENGLYRFDGIKYYKYDYGKTESKIQGFTVISIYEDSGNDIWVGTFGALNRIDMKSGRISHFLPDSFDFASPDNIIRFITEDRKGLLWLITDRDIFTLNRELGSFTRFSIDSLGWRSGYPPIVYENERFLEDRSGRIWIATNNGLYLFDKEWRRIYPGESDSLRLKQNKINCVREDYKGNIWFGTQGNGLFKITDPKRGIYEKEILVTSEGNTTTNETITAIYSDSSKYIWLYGNCTLSRYDPDNGKTESYYFSSEKITDRKWQEGMVINDIFGDQDGSLWLISLGWGLIFRFNPGNEKLFLYFVPVYIEICCAQDNTGNFWFGSLAFNNYRFVKDVLPFQFRNIQNGGYADMSHKARMIQDDEGKIWFALTGGIFNIKESDIASSSSFEKFNIPGVNIQPTSIFKDCRGNLWFGFIRGVIIKYFPADNLFTRYELPVDPDQGGFGNTLVIQEDKSGNIWFATLLGGIFKLSAGEDKIKQFISLEELHGKAYITSLLDFMVDSNDELWISTFHGLFKTDKDKAKVTNFTGFDNTGRTYLNCFIRIIEDHNRNIWFLNYQEGLYIFNRRDESFSKVTIPELSPGSAYADLLLDQNGKIWISRFDRLTVIDTLKKTAKDYFIQVQGIDAQSSGLNSGMNLFIRNYGLFIFNREIPRNKIIPPVYITRLFINNKEYRTLYPGSDPVTDIKKIDVNFNENNIKIEYAALNFTHPELNEYRYFMRGLDPDTVQAGTGMTAEYRQIPSGKYKFWVTGSNNDGIWNPSGTSFDIRIHPPWYKSVLAYIVYIILFSTLIAAFIRFRISRLTREKAKLESEIKIHTAELERKNLQLAETDRIKTDFFTSISHEIRTPLSLIIGPLDALSKEENPDERKSGMIEMMTRNAHRLMVLVNQLLDISRLDAGKMSIILSEEDLIKYLRILVFEFLSLAESKHIKYIAELPDEEFITWFDRDKIEKIISNLLTNAFKFTPQGGTVKCSVVIEPCEKENIKYILRVTVSDTGQGMSREHLRKIFDRFYRAENSGETEGTGIGLSLTQELISLLHGEIRVDSEPGEGSEFTVSLPLGKEYLLDNEYIIAQRDTITTGKIQLAFTGAKPSLDADVKSNGRMNLLIIEDNEDLRNYLQTNLSDEYNILCDENGKTGLHTAFTMMPDIILTDIMMPGLDGISLCSQLKNNELTSHIPIILLTAKSSVTDKIEGLKSGADDYIIKPFSIDELKVRISNLLGLRERLRLKYSNLHRFSVSDQSMISIDDKFMEKVVRTIQENIRNFDFNVEMLHEIIGMSRMHLTRKLKVLTGLPPGILIRNMRLEKAAELILHKTGNITEIANSVGISNPSYFTKSFRHYFGVSPKDYPKRYTVI